MSTFRNPVGPQPSNVYWRRRLVVLLGLVAVIVIVILIVARPGSGKPTPTPSTGPSASANGTPAPGSSNIPADAKACDPAKVTVTAGVDSNSYAAGVNPMLTFALKNTSTVPCTFLAGSDVQEFRVTSGDELIWDSKDCQTGQVAATVLLQPFVPFPGTPIPWDRTRSAKDTCDTARDQVTAAGASYHLQVIVNGVKSDDPQFILQ